MALKPVGPTGDGRLLSPHYKPLPTKDGFITVGPNTNTQAFAFFEEIGRPELKTDPRFDSAASRTANAEAYFKVRVEGLVQKTTTEWLDICDRRDIPAQRYNTIEDLLEDPHLKEVNFYDEVDHPSEGRIWRTRPANTFGAGLREDQRHAPLLGEDTRSVLADVGYKEAEIDAMLASGGAHEPKQRMAP